jgi:UDP-glucose 4-epimerase
MEVLVTGGAGYIGSIVADQLLRAGHKVTVLDNLIMGWREAVPAEAEFVQANTGDEAALEALFASHDFDAVMHFAALIEAGESVKAPEQYFDNNSLSTLTLLRVMLRHKVSRFVFSSTAAVYGEPRTVPIPEDHPLSPTNPYGQSKLMVEQMLKWVHNAHGLRFASLRYFNAAGAMPGRGEAHRSESHLIPLILRVPLGQRDDISIFGTDYPTKDGTCVRDYVHIEDIASAHLLALQALNTEETLVLNLGSGSGFTVREVIDVARKVSGHAIPVRECPRRPGDPAVLVARSDKARSLLGWSPQHASLESMVASAWEWHRTHPKGYSRE